MIDFSVMSVYWPKQHYFVSMYAKFQCDSTIILDFMNFLLFFETAIRAQNSAYVRNSFLVALLFIFEIFSFFFLQTYQETLFPSNENQFMKKFKGQYLSEPPNMSFHSPPKLSIYHQPSGL